MQDDAIREKALQAQQIKEHLLNMASASERAKNISRSLQESVRIRDGLRAQLQDVELQREDRHHAIGALELKQTELTNKLESHQAELESLHAQIEEEANLQAIEAEEVKLQAIEAEVQAKRDELGTIKEQLGQWDLEVSNFVAVSTELRAEVVGLEDQVESTRKASEELEKSKEELKRLEKDVARVKEIRTLEEILQKLRQELQSAREMVQDRTQREEEIRLQVINYQDLVKAAEDKLLHQEEHSTLQFATLQKLEGQKQRYDTEVEMLTLGLHEAEQRNALLRDNNARMQQEVGGLGSNSVSEWGARAREAMMLEVSRCCDEIHVWKAKAEKLRSEKQFKLSSAQRHNEESMRTAREQLRRLKAEISTREQNLRTLRASPSGLSDR